MLVGLLIAAHRSFFFIYFLPSFNRFIYEELQLSPVSVRSVGVVGCTIV